LRYSGEKILFTVLMVGLLLISVAGCADTDDATPISADEAISPTISANSSTNP